MCEDKDQRIEELEAKVESLRQDLHMARSEADSLRDDFFEADSEARKTKRKLDKVKNERDEEKRLLDVALDALDLRRSPALEMRIRERVDCLKESDNVSER